MISGALMTAEAPQVALDGPSLLIVLGLALLSTLSAKRMLSGPALISHFGNADVRAGWIGLIIGLVLTANSAASMTGGSTGDLLKTLMLALSVAFLPLLYGYICQFLCKIITQQD